MAITYRTTDVDKWGAGKDALLLSVEIDNNFWTLAQQLAEIAGNPIQPKQISNITLQGSQLNIYLSDGTKFGPYTIPFATMRFRGDWTAGQTYFEMDLIRVVSQGLFIVVRNHVAGSVFDANASTSAGNLYSLIMPASGVVPTDFLSLTDTPTGFFGHADKLVAVNEDGTGLTFIPRVSSETSFADSARLGTTENIDITVGGLLEIDGIQTIEDDRVLVKDQTTSSENGLYLVKDEAEWVRTADAPTLASMEGVVVFVEEGVLNNGRMFVLTAEGTVAEPDTLDWQAIINKPLLFPPSEHTHTISEIEGLEDALNNANGGSTTQQIISYSGNRTLELTDAGNYLRSTGGTASTLTVPTNDAVAFPVGTLIHHRTAGDGKVTFAGSGGVVVNPPFGQTLTTPGAGATVAMLKVATDAWDIIGHTEATT